MAVRDASEDLPIDEVGATPNARPRVQSVARAAEILVAVAQSANGLATKEITDQLGMSRQGAYHLIHTLTSVGLLARTERNRYVLGLAVGTLAAGFERQLAPPEHLAVHVRALAAATNETAYAAGWQRGEIVVMSVARGTAPVQAAEVVTGTAEDGHARASGKLLLANASADAREAYLAHHVLRKRTRRTITTRSRLDAEFDRIREQGYAIDDEEFADGLACIAVPLDGGASPFVIGLSIPVERFRGDSEAYLRKAREVARSVSMYR